MKVRLQSLPYGLRLLLATLSLGIGTGLVGIACHYLLEGVQGLAFGQDTSDLLQQFQEAGGLRRFLVLCVTGCLAAGFWYVLQKRYKILSIRQQIDLAGDRERILSSSQRAKSLDCLWCWSWFSCGLSGPLCQ